MKQLLLTLTTTLLCAGASGQGRLLFDINSDNLIYFTTARNYLMPADAAATADNGFGAGPLPIAGSTLYTGLGLNNTPGTIASLAGSPSFVVALYGGTSPNSMSLQATTTIGDVSNPGGIVPTNLTFANLPAGTPAYFQVQVYDSRAGSACGAWAMGWYAGVSQIFQATPQASAISPIYWTQPPVNSTWAAGTFEPVDLVQVGPGYFGGIVVYGLLGFAAPYIYSQPQSTTNYWGQSATFTIGAFGEQAPSYQWVAHGTNLSDSPHISGSATPSLTLNGITRADAGSYQVLASNCVGTTASQPVTLTVVLIPPSISNAFPQPDGSMTLNLTGTPYSTNRLWATASLTPPVVWSPVSTNVASPAGTWQVTDTQPIGWTTRFYRASMP